MVRLTHLRRGERLVDLNVGLHEGLCGVVQQRGVRRQARLQLVHHKVGYHVAVLSVPFSLEPKTRATGTHVETRARAERDVLQLMVLYLHQNGAVESTRCV